MKFIIRQPSIADIPDMARVHVETWRTTYRGIIADSFLEYLSLQKHLERHQKYMAMPGTIYSVAEVEGQRLVGFLSGGPKRDASFVQAGELYAINILEQHRRSGIGAAMKRQWANNLRNANINAGYVWVLAANQPAVTFYEKLGAKFVREQMIQIGGQSLRELAYGWDDLRALTDP
ncbi:MAG TPA: GNAT family N-acetyltransferase [Tepidisphaeraceae bacterium]|jgi:ribosomal protein S18 acetylase RimI-like enzyme